MRLQSSTQISRYLKSMILKRFLAKVDKIEGGCWNWTASQNGNGYGWFQYPPDTLAHRASYRFFRGDPGKLFVLHRCDNRLCVNPYHLFLGTCQDNADDKVAKNRQLTGSKVGNAKLHEVDLPFIRHWRSVGYLQKDIALVFGVTRENISRIDRQLCWKP